ncbi:MAG: polyprenyl synthetase family protein [Alphaproteobacteria bacterium]|nr:polyprenyl synthetase family protein [Alphaproteobacteria bacterium]
MQIVTVPSVRVEPGVRWQDPVVRPRARAVARAIDRAATVSPARHDGPRAGWLAALAYGVAYTYGGSVDRKALALAAVVLEGANAFVFTDRSGDLVAIARLLADERLRTTAQRLTRERAEWLESLAARLRAGRVGRRPVPEGVLSARAAVLLGGLCGGVDPALTASLDEVATWIGLAWEQAQGTLDDVGWRGAWEALGLERDRTCPVRGARDALSALPYSALVEQLDDALAMTPAPGRVFQAWRPHPVPLSTREPATEGPLAAAVEAAMDAVVGEGPPLFVASARYLRVQGGKRVRPRVVLAACEACGGAPERAVLAAAVIEWLHTASLVLDDILDDAHVRRGGPTLHRATDRAFAVAVFAWLLDRILLATRDLDADTAQVVRTAAERLADGQGSELAETGRPGLGRTAYHRIIATKTASLFASAAEVGALAANAPPPRVAALRRYGHAVGLAFQIADDVLDYTADEADFGKRPGTDLLAGKATLPWLILRDAATDAERARLDADLGRGADWTWIRTQVVQSGAAEAALSDARVHRDDAVRALDSLPAGPARDALAALAHHVVERRT